MNNELQTINELSSINSSALGGVNLGNFYLSNQCESAQSVVKNQSIKNNKLCKTNPISEKLKMIITLVARTNYNEQ